MCKLLLYATVVTAISSNISVVVVGAIDAVDGDEVLFVIGNIAILASQPYCSYDDRCSSLKT